MSVVHPLMCFDLLEVDARVCIFVGHTLEKVAGKVIQIQLSEDFPESLLIWGAKTPEVGVLAMGTAEGRTLSKHEEKGDSCTENVSLSSIIQVTIVSCVMLLVIIRE